MAARAKKELGFFARWRERERLARRKQAAILRAEDEVDRRARDRLLTAQARLRQIRAKPLEECQ